MFWCFKKQKRTQLNICKIIRIIKHALELLTSILIVFVILIHIADIPNFLCGVNLVSVHILIYAFIDVYLLVFILYADLIIFYFMKTEREQKIGFLMERKKEVILKD